MFLQNMSYTLKTLVKNRNVDGTVYRSDVANWLGAAWSKLNFKERQELIEKLTEIDAENK